MKSWPAIPTISVYKERVSPGVQSSFNHSIPARVSNVSMTKGHAAICCGVVCVCIYDRDGDFPILVMRVSLSLFSSHSNSEKYFSSTPLSRSAFVWVKQRQAEEDDDGGGDGDECAVCA